MLQRRMNNWTTASDRGIKCLERLSCVHTSGIGAFYTFGDIFLTKLFDGFCFVPVGDVRTMFSSPSIPSTG